MRKLLLLMGVLLLAGVQLLAQQRTIIGKITDADGNTVPNASVLVKGTTNGTTTKPDGTYSLSVSPQAKAIVISSVGMETVEVNIGNKGVIDISLKQADKDLQEVVVTALGIKKDKKTLGYGVSTIKAEELTQAHTTNVTNALAGKIPGVKISGSGGSFTGSSIIIRGV
ncbi:MAG: carboxypeptidase-like regulatory domain-containing protein, partial [Chitinophagaceae bacterium]